MCWSPSHTSNGPRILKSTLVSPAPSALGRMEPTDAAECAPSPRVRPGTRCAAAARTGPSLPRTRAGHHPVARDPTRGGQRNPNDPGDRTSQHLAGVERPLLHLFANAPFAVRPAPT